MFNAVESPHQKRVFNPCLTASTLRMGAVTNVLRHAVCDSKEKQTKCVSGAEIESKPHSVLHVQEVNLLKNIDIKRYSSYEFLLRVCAYVIREMHTPLDSIELSAEEIEHAEIQLIRALKHGLASTNLTRNLRLAWDEDGLIRSHISASEANCPILLPKNELLSHICQFCPHQNLTRGRFFCAPIS